MGPSTDVRLQTQPALPLLLQKSPSMSTVSQGQTHGKNYQ